MGLPFRWYRDEGKRTTIGWVGARGGFCWVLVGPTGRTWGYVWQDRHDRGPYTWRGALAGRDGLLVRDASARHARMVVASDARAELVRDAVARLGAVAPGHHAEVVEYATGAVVRRLGPMPEQKVGRVARALALNLDTARFYTRAVEVKP